MKLELRPGATSEDDADDVAKLITARNNAEEIEQLLSTVIKKVLEWMTEQGLTLGLNKTDFIFLARYRMETTIPLIVGDLKNQTHDYISTGKSFTQGCKLQAPNEKGN